MALWMLVLMACVVPFAAGHRIRASLVSNVSSNSSRTVRIRGLFQNPHWECFYRNPTGECKQGHKELYSGLAKNHDMDFAGLAMGPEGWRPPSGFGVMEHRSGPEWHHLAWRESRWEREAYKKTDFRGGRAVILARFRSKKRPDFKVIVASMHYPHDKHGVKKVAREIVRLAASQTNNVLFMADTNVGLGQSCQHLMQEFGVKGKARHTTLRKTCCADGKFGLHFDRIWSNFGELTTIDDAVYMSLTNHLKRAPDWAYKARARHGGPAAYHHPVMAEIIAKV